MVFYVELYRNCAKIWSGGRVIVIWGCRKYVAVYNYLCLKYALMEWQGTALVVWRLLFHIACQEMLDHLPACLKSFWCGVFGNTAPQRHPQHSSNASTLIKNYKITHPRLWKIWRAVFPNTPHQKLFRQAGRWSSIC